MRIVDQVRRYPGVSDVTVSFFNSYPQSGTWNGGQLFNDTIFANIQQMTFRPAPTILESSGYMMPGREKYLRCLRKENRESI